MNCKQAQELLPLYAGRDLDEKRTRLVTEHVQSCAGCARVADEYRAAFQLTQPSAAPVFSGDVYAGIRRRVLRQIEDDQVQPALAPLLAGWFRPRVTWAFASALVVAFAMFAFYFVVSRRAGHEPIVENRGTVSQNDQGKQSSSPEVTQNSRTPPSYSPTKGSEPKRPTIRNSGRLAIVARMNDSSSRTAKSSRRVHDAGEADTLPSNDSSLPDRPLRVEMQTKDPNIRIIWFSQPSTKPALPNSKGI